MRSRRSRAFLLCLMLALLVSLSLGAVLLHEGHDCTGLHCPVCCQLADCLRLLRLLSIVVLGVALCAQVCAVRRVHARCAQCVPHFTPVSLKVKLSN